MKIVQHVSQNSFFVQTKVFGQIFLRLYQNQHHLQLRFVIFKTLANATEIVLTLAPCAVQKKENNTSLCNTKVSLQREALKR